MFGLQCPLCSLSTGRHKSTADSPKTATVQFARRQLKSSGPVESESQRDAETLHHDVAGVALAFQRRTIVEDGRRAVPATARENEAAPNVTARLAMVLQLIGMDGAAADRSMQLTRRERHLQPAADVR
jgi:hypothetical protein